MAKNRYTAAARFGRRYPWDVWLAAGTFTAVRGVDFNGRTDTFTQHVRNYASRKGYRASVVTSEDGASITVTLTRKV